MLLLYQQHGYRPHDEAAAYALHQSGMSRAAMLEALLSYPTDTALLTDFVKQGILVRTGKGAYEATNQPRHDEMSDGYQPPRFASAANSPVVLVQQKEYEARRNHTATTAGFELSDHGRTQLRVQGTPGHESGGVFATEQLSAQQQVQLAQEEEDARRGLEQAGGADLEEVIATVVRDMRAKFQRGTMPPSQPGEGWSDTTAGTRDFSSMAASSCPNSHDELGAPVYEQFGAAAAAAAAAASVPYSHTTQRAAATPRPLTAYPTEHLTFAAASCPNSASSVGSARGA